jgi:hypothetical protein
MKQGKAIIVILSLAIIFSLLITSCVKVGRRGNASTPTYATKIKASFSDPKHPVNVYNKALTEMKPILLSFNVQGAT